MAIKTRIREVTFSVPFVIGKARPRVTMHGTFTPAATRRAEQAIREAYEQAVADKGGTVDDYRAGKFEKTETQDDIRIPVSVTIWTQRPLPKSKRKSILTEPDTCKPDADNIEKLVMDALNGVAWIDDSQVTDLSVRKDYRYRNAPERTTVRILWGDDWSEEE